MAKFVFAPDRNLQSRPPTPSRHRLTSQLLTRASPHVRWTDRGPRTRRHNLRGGSVRTPLGRPPAVTLQLAPACVNDSDDLGSARPCLHRGVERCYATDERRLHATDERLHATYERFRVASCHHALLCRGEQGAEMTAVTMSGTGAGSVRPVSARITVNTSVKGRCTDNCSTPVCGSGNGMEERCGKGYGRDGWSGKDFRGMAGAFVQRAEVGRIPRVRRVAWVYVSWQKRRS